MRTCAVLLLFVIGCFQFFAPNAAAVVPWKFKGFSYTNDKYCPNVTFDSEGSDLSLYNLAGTGANYIALVVTQWQDSLRNTTIKATNRTSTDAGLVRAIQTAHKLGLKVMLKPQVDLIDDDHGSSWRGNIGQGYDTEKWKEWFASYTTMIVHYATLGQQNGVEVFSLGCELITASDQDQGWRAVAASVRSVFKGNVTYSANWGGEEVGKRWWDVVDFIGVDAYYPLGSTLTQQINSWRDLITRTLVPLCRKWNKLLAFTETGTCSGGCQSGHPNQDQMEIFLEAIFQVFGTDETPWFLGMFWWNWVSDPAFGGPENSCMSPAFKPAETTFRNAYGGTYPSKQPTYPAKCLCIL